MRNLLRKVRGFFRSKERATDRRTIRSILADLRPVFGGADVLPRFSPSHFKTYTCSGAVIGGRLVASTGDRTVATAGDESTKVVGVAHRDGVANQQVAVGRLSTYLITAAGAVEEGDRLVAAADGAVKVFDDVTMTPDMIIGYNAAGDVADTAVVEVNLTV